MVFVGLLVAGFLLIGISFLIFPAKIVQLHARFSAGLNRNMLGRSDASMDSWMMPWDRWLVGRASEYLDAGPSEPRRFPRALIYIRILGLICLMFALIIIRKHLHL